MLASIFNYLWSWWDWAFPRQEPEVEMFYRGVRPYKKYSMVFSPPPVTWNPTPPKPREKVGQRHPLASTPCRLKPPLYPRKPPMARKRPRLNIEEDYLMRL